jgi:hypothetical protein
MRLPVLCCAAGLLYAFVTRSAWPEASAVNPEAPRLVAQQKERAAPKAGKEETTPAKGTPVAPTGAPAEIPAPQAPSGQVGEFQPVLHAQGAKISTCMDTVVAESAAVIDSGHTAISSWSSSAPNNNAFLSIIGLQYADKTAPNAAAVIVAAPVGPAKCDGATVQIYPVARPCSAVQASLIKQGHTVAMLGALPVVETKAGYRDVLLPSAGGGCVLILVGLRQ